MKRLRRSCDGKNIKYYHCGEYGETSRRPHYHALLFGHDFADKCLWKKSGRGDQIFTSEALSKVWGLGFATTGAVTFESAAYVARYVMKKITGEAAVRHYEVTDAVTGEISRLQPEYRTMSLRGNEPGEPGGIGAGWYKKFKSDVYPSDFLVLRGQKMKPPKYYDRLLELEDPEARARIKEQRTAQALLRQGDATSARLRVREECKLAKIKTLKRETE